ncbi:MAG: GTPase HflX [Myxococcota bacterium]
MPEPIRPRAVLVGVQLPGVTAEEQQGSLDELARLVITLGYDVVGRVVQRRTSLDGSVVLGDGKLEELAAFTGGSGVVEATRKRKPQKKDLHTPRLPGGDPSGRLDDDDDDDDGDSDDARSDQLADVVVVDHELSPLQFRNLASASGGEVLDRTGVIVEIFHRHASSREARLQVELARLAYVAPRMRASAGGFDRAGGGVGAKGKGESQLELDKRKIRDRVAELKAALAEIETSRAVRRARRREANRVALVGYTNAGKSSWMRALTGSAVLVEDKLFATLDTTVRELQPPTRPKILVSDTVGFIKKLPHDLVASFRSTLDEAAGASLLVYVVDASDPTFRAQLEVTRTVLAEIDAGDLPSMMLLNKCDRLDADARARLAVEFPDALQVSAKDPADVTAIRQTLIDRLAASLPEAELVVPYDRGALIGEIRESAQVLQESYEDDGVHYRLRADSGTLERLQGLIG